MIVVTDTSVVLNLCWLRQESLLPAIYEDVFAPGQVRLEFERKAASDPRFNETDRGEILQRQEVPPRVSVATRRSEKNVLFESCYHGLNDAVLHENLVAN